MKAILVILTHRRRDCNCGGKLEIMFSCEFDAFSTRSITLRFYCSECGEEIEEIIESLPSPNLMSERDTYSGTLETDCTDIECPNCHNNYNIQLASSMYGGELYSDDLDEDTEMEVENIENDYFEDYSEIVESNTSFFDTFCIQMEANKRLFEISVLASDMKTTLNKLLFANIITCLETYLSDALINTVLGTEIYLKRFVENFKDYKDCSFKLCDIYKKIENLKKLVKKDLYELMYHNLPKIKEIYKTILNIDFPNTIGDIMTKIHIRHHLVHRNGKNQDGDQVIVKKEELNQTYDLIFEFVKEIDNQFKERIITVEWK